KIAFLTAENESLKARCRQLSDQLVKKDKELTNLTDPTEVNIVKCNEYKLKNAKLLQSLGENRLQTVRIFRQLHQRLYKLEGQLKEKDAQYSQIVTDLKYTRVEELRTQLEVAFSEVQRLQKLVRSQSEELCHWRNLQQARANKKKNDPEFMELVRRVKTLGQVIKSMDEQKKELIARNDFLVNRMHQLLANDNSSGKDFDKGRVVTMELSRSGSIEHNESADHLQKRETSVSNGFRHNQPVARPIPSRNEFADELASVRSHANSLELTNQHLREDVAFYKKQSELAKSSRKARDVNPVEGKKTANLTKDEHSAILIQRAWRQHRNRGLELRKQQRAQDMHERAEAREQEAAKQLIKSTLHGHLSRQSSFRSINRSNETASEADEVDTGTFGTDDSRTSATGILPEEKDKNLTNLKAAIHGHLERERSLSSLQQSDDW
ncbi:hypothetical protein FBUS_02433, partial [Fasciolopsis buskii]